MRRTTLFQPLLLALAVVVGWSAPGYGASAPTLAQAEKILAERCTGCHNLNPNAAATLPSQRRAPDLSYAGNKFRRDWLFLWMQAPSRLRPAGSFYADHIKTSDNWDEPNPLSLPNHPALTPVEAVTVVEVLMARQGRAKLLEDVTLKETRLSPIMGDLMFEKAKGCIACHQSGPDYGGFSGVELYTAYARLNPKYIYSYIRDPQAWDPGIWMPTLGLSDIDLNKLVKYLELIAVDPGFSRHRQGTTRSAEIYRTYCYQCHGMKGDGSGVNVRDMAVKPRDHTDSVGMAKITDQRIFDAIRGGGISVGKSALMPAWGGLFDDQEIAGLVSYLRVLCKCKGPGS